MINLDDLEGEPDPNPDVRNAEDDENKRIQPQNEFYDGEKDNDKDAGYTIVDAQRESNHSLDDPLTSVTTKLNVGDAGVTSISATSGAGGNSADVAGSESDSKNGPSNSSANDAKTSS